MRTHLLLAFTTLAPLLGLACTGDDYPGGTTDGTLPPPPATPGADAGGPPLDASSAGEAAVDGQADAAPPAPPPIDPAPPARPAAICSDGNSPPAYVLAQNGTLFAFDPGTLAMRALGIPSCAPYASAFAVSASGSAYVVTDALYRVDLATLACTRTPYVPAPYTGTALTVGAASSSDRLWSYVPSPPSSIGVSDLSGAPRFPTGTFVPQSPSGAVDLTMDAFGRMFALGSDGTLAQLDPATGAVLGQDRTGFDGEGAGPAMALLAYGGQLYFVSGPSGAVSRYDVATKELQPLGLLDQTIVGASAPACAASDSIPDAGAESAAPEAATDDDAGATATAASPFSPGDAWMGTYTCPQGLTDLALVIDAVAGNAIQARFDFQTVGGAENGSFVLRGTFDPDTREATFTPGAWVWQPGSSWTPVGLDGYVDLGGHQLAGSVTFDGCGSFLVQR